MTVVLLAFAIYCLATASYKPPFRHEFHADNFSKDSTDCVNGIFVVLVFLSHFFGYVVHPHPVDKLYRIFQGAFGQGIVCSFLFYSGYGTYESLRRDRAGYTHKLLRVKFPKLLVRFDICVMLFAVTQLAIGNSVSAIDILFALSTLGGFGNSNWYVTYMLIAYVITWGAFSVLKNDAKALLVITVGMAVYAAAAFVILRGDRGQYYATSLVFPMGMGWSMFREKIEPAVKKHWFALIVLASVLYAAARCMKMLPLVPDVIYYNIAFMLFAAMSILLTFKVSFKNRIIAYLGKNVFLFYILQRLPMIWFAGVQNNESLNKIVMGGGGTYVYLFLCAFATVLLVEAFRRVFALFRL